MATKSNFASFPAALGSALVAWLSLLAPSASAGEDPNNYRVVGDRYTTQARASDGRVFTFGSAECVDIRTNKNDAIIVWVERPGRPPERRVEKKSNMLEFTSPMSTRGYQKSLFGDFVGAVQDIFNAGQGAVHAISENWAVQVVTSIVGISNDIRNLIKHILQLYGALSGKMATEMKAADGVNAVGEHALNIRDVNAGNPQAPISAKFIEALRRTLQNDPAGRRTVASALGIMGS